MAMTTKQRDDLDKAALNAIEKLQAENAALREALATGKPPVSSLAQELHAKVRHPGGARDATHLIGAALEQHKLRKARETVARARPEADPHNRRVKALGDQIKKAGARGEHVSVEELRRRAGLR